MSLAGQPALLYIEKRDENRLIGPNFSLQKHDAKPHTSKTTIEAISRAKNKKFSLIGPDTVISGITGHSSLLICIILSIF